MNIVKGHKLQSIRRELSKNCFMYVLATPGIIWILIFSYLPLIGLIIAFQDFHPMKGIFSDFVGLENFEFFFTSGDWEKVTFNTFYLNILFIIFQTIAAIVLAVMVSELTVKLFKKVTQSIMILPHFISWPVMAMFSLAFFSTDNGLFNSILENMGLQKVNFNTSPKIWPTLLVFFRIWKNSGFSSIIYLAVIMGINPELYESAKMDGASRFQCIFRITIPLLKNTVILLTLMAIGRIFYGDFGMIYAIIGENSLLFPTTDVIDTYVFRALRRAGSMGMATAVGLYQSIIGFILVIVANALARKYSSEAALF